MKVIGITGPAGSGKTTVAEHLNTKYGFEVISVGDCVREEVLESGQQITLDACDKISVDRIAKYGESYWSKKVAERISAAGCEKVAIDGLRSKFDIQFMKTKFGDEIKVIKIDATPENRFSRMVADNKQEMPKTLDEFAAMEKRQDEMFKPSEAEPLIDLVIENDADLNTLYAKVDEAVAMFKFD